MKLFRNKKTAIPVAILMVILLAYLAVSIYFKSHFYFRSTVNGVEASGQSAATVMQELKDKEREYSLTITDADGNETNFEIHTDKETVGDALLELDMIAGEDSEYGLYVKTVNGITADYDKDQTYWAFYVNGEYAQTGVDSTNVTAGDTYSFKVEK